jgi:hypothetical protein
MFIRTRRTLAGLTAVAALAGAVGTQAVTAPVAAAAPACKQWKIPKYFYMDHTNGWHVETGPRRANNTYKAYGMAPGNDEYTLFGTMKLSRFDISGHNAQVRFTITWNNGSGGVYTGTIDDDGFLTGNSVDKFNPRSKAGWNYTETIDCA